MAVFNEPSKWAQTLGQDADYAVITNTASDTDPSIDKIFPSVFSIPLAQGGRAIPRSVLNGFFRLLGDWVYYIQNGGVASYSNTFDYAVGSFVKYNNEFYRCIQANGVSSTVKAPTDSAYWSKITTLADVANAFANQDLSNLSASGQAVIDNKADISFLNVNDTANILMSYNAMPSITNKILTIGASGTTYTAPSNGYVYVNITSTGANQSFDIRTNNSSRIIRSYSSATNQNICIIMPVRKGDSFSVVYPSGATVNVFVFIYANGSVSEA